MHNPLDTSSTLACFGIGSTSIHSVLPSSLLSSYLLGHDCTLALPEGDLSCP
jgi:hypothetical protein